MGIPLHTFTAAQRASVGLSIPCKPQRAKRGEGAWSKRKAARTARLSRIQALFGCPMPDEFRVCAYPSKMNGWEKKYAEQLMIKAKAGLILDWEFEPVEIYLAPGVRYCPDFLVRFSSSFKFVEVKGKNRQGFSARIDIYKIAKEKFSQFSWELVELVNGSWQNKRIYSGESK